MSEAKKGFFQEHFAKLMFFLALLSILLAIGFSQNSFLPVFILQDKQQVLNPVFFAVLGFSVLIVLGFSSFLKAVQSRKEQEWHDNILDRHKLEELVWANVDVDGKYRKARGYDLQLSIFEGSRFGLAWFFLSGLLEEFCVITVFGSKKNHVLYSPVFNLERHLRLLDVQDIVSVAQRHFPENISKQDLQREVLKIVKQEGDLIEG